MAGDLNPGNWSGYRSEQRLASVSCADARFTVGSLLALLLVGAYLLGSIPFSQVVARLRGSICGTAAAATSASAIWTCRRLAMGADRWGLDGLKGLFPVLIAQNMGFGRGAAGWWGCIAVGHNWSVF